MQKVKKLTPHQEAELQAEEEARQERRRNFRRELLGVFGGAGLALMISALIPVIRDKYSLGLVISWGGAVGGVMMNLDRFEKAGAVLTKKQNRLLNYLIGLGIPVLAVLLLFWVTK